MMDIKKNKFDLLINLSDVINNDKSYVNKMIDGYGDEVDDIKIINNMELKVRLEDDILTDIVFEYLDSDMTLEHLKKIIFVY